MKGANLLVIMPESFLRGGIEAFLLGLYDSGIPDGVQVDLLVPSKVVATDNARKLEEQGIHIIEGGLDYTNRAAKRQSIRQLLVKTFSEGHYDAIHVNTGWPWFMRICLQLADKYNVPIRIGHSHGNYAASGTIPLWKRALDWQNVTVAANHASIMLACSNAAGEYVFGEKEWRKRGRVIPNAIDAKAFGFSLEARQKSRDKAGVGQSTLVMGNVGRLDPIKNHSFLLETFAEVLKLNPDSALWIVGDGELRAQLEEKAVQLGVSNSVVFWGDCSQVGDILSGMDVFVFPSSAEGLGIAAIEAQAAGLPCIVSSNVSNEVDIPGCSVMHLALTDGPENWARAIVVAPIVRDSEAWKRVKQAGFDSETTAGAFWQMFEEEFSSVRCA